MVTFHYNPPNFPQESFATNAPSLELMEASLRETAPVEHYKAYLRSLAIVPYRASNLKAAASAANPSSSRHII